MLKRHTAVSLVQFWLGIFVACHIILSLHVSCLFLHCHCQIKKKRKLVKWKKNNNGLSGGYAALLYVVLFFTSLLRIRTPCCVCFTFAFSNIDLL